MAKNNFNRTANVYGNEGHSWEMKQTKIPAYMVFSMMVSPIACSKYDEAIDAAMRYSQEEFNTKDTFRVFDTIVGKFSAAYRNGKEVEL